MDCWRLLAGFREPFFWRLWSLPTSRKQPHPTQLLQIPIKSRVGRPRKKRNKHQTSEWKSIPNIIKAIAEAREHGDLSENAEYHAAREKQSFIEGRISELENKISRAEVIDISSLDNSKIAFGATVQITDLSNDKIHTFTIVGADESDIEKNLISVSAPLGRAMINKTLNDVIEVSTPGGLKEYQINSIKYS